VDKPGTRVLPEASIRVRGGRRFVSRGGEKLAGALEDLAIEVRGRSVLDLGASTGGFTDCLLQAGADRVAAVDVGYGQLASPLRDDPRVVVLERTNARHLEPEALPFSPDLITVDVSFISVRLLLPRMVTLAPGAEWLILVKPQFEVGRERVGKGGVVRDDALRHEVASEVAAEAARLGYAELARCESRLPGPKGNREIFLQLRPAPAESGGR
jgi:23S rRNA (cytidine1920-2'-O)/16S rRNA (cytidine1409-2'-O)-methyltransferase